MLRTTPSLRSGSRWEVRRPAELVPKSRSEADCINQNQWRVERTVPMRRNCILIDQERIQTD